MNDQQKKERHSGDRDKEIRAAMDQHWAAIIGGGDLWITEFILTYDGKPSYTVSIMEFRDDKVARETQYFADPFVAPAWRAQWIERMDT
jgi:hypothetical protein